MHIMFQNRYRHIILVRWKRTHTNMRVRIYFTMCILHVIHINDPFGRTQTDIDYQPLALIRTKPLSNTNPRTLQNKEKVG